MSVKALGELQHAAHVKPPPQQEHFPALQGGQEQFPLIHMSISCGLQQLLPAAPAAGVRWTLHGPGASAETKCSSPNLEVNRVQEVDFITVQMTKPSVPACTGTVLPPEQGNQCSPLC